MTNEIGWCIERQINSDLRYWGGRAANHFTPKHDEAIRFARQEDANIVLAWLCDGQGRVAEHAWCSEPKEPRTATGSVD